jgi:hypothetical protein
MNRIFALILVISLALSMSAFAEDESPFVGKWYASDMEMMLEGVPVNRNPLIMGCSALLIVEAEGDGELRLSSASGLSESDIDWTSEDNRLVATLESGDAITFELTADGRLKQIVGTEQYLYYSRDLPVAGELAPALEDVAIDDFVGAWTVASVSQYDFSIDLDVAGITGMQLIYEGGDSVSLLFPGEDSEPLSYAPAVLDGNVLSVMDGLIQLRLLDDGSMHAAMPMTFGMADLIFTK